MKHIKAAIVKLVLGVAALYLLWLGFKWTAMRVYVGTDEALVVTRKFGHSLPEGLVVAPEGTQYKGIQEEVLGPGRYFFDPIEYEWQVIKQVQIPAGSPDRWEWDDVGNLKDPSTAPMIGLVSYKQGKVAENGQEVVPSGYRGIQQEVLTPGTYKLNPSLVECTIVPAVVVPPGSVGVVTRLTGDIGPVTSASLTPANSTTAPSTQPTHLVVGPNQRGILNNVLQPGIYYLNPKMAKVTIVTVGYDQITLDHRENTAVRFYSSDGYQVEADFTVVWGRTPADAPNIVANIGSIAKVRTNVIEPAMKAACQNEGGKYTAKELIQGDTRSQFQEDLSQALEKQIQNRNVHVLLALVRNISIKDTAGKDQTMGLLATIQRANIEVERDLTNKQKTQTAMVEAELQQALKLVDVNRETVASETKVKVANIMAEGRKKAAQIDAQRELSVSSIDLEVAKLNAQRTQILGKAAADVQQMKSDAEAQGAKLLVQALGSPQAYNQYIFAKNFDPGEVRLIFAGPGTFWTDLKTFEQVGASRMIQQQQQQSQPKQ